MIISGAIKPSKDLIDCCISFTKSGDTDFLFLPSPICDANNVCENIQQTILNDQITLTVPISFLNNSNNIYPITIDPSIILNNNSILWNGDVNNQTDAVSIFVMAHNPANFIKAGTTPYVAGEKNDYRAAIDSQGSNIYSSYLAPATNLMIN